MFLLMEVGTALVMLSDQHHANHSINSETRASLRVLGSCMLQGAEPRRGQTCSQKKAPLPVKTTGRFGVTAASVGTR